MGLHKTKTRLEAGMEQRERSTCQIWLADPMIIAIMTSRQKKRTKIENFENGVVIILYQNNCFEQASPLTGASNCVDSLLKAVIMMIFER